MWQKPTVRRRRISGVSAAASLGRPIPSLLATLRAGLPSCSRTRRANRPSCKPLALAMRFMTSTDEDDMDYGKIMVLMSDPTGTVPADADLSCLRFKGRWDYDYRPIPSKAIRA